MVRSLLKKGGIKKEKEEICEMEKKEMVEKWEKEKEQYEKDKKDMVKEWEKKQEEIKEQNEMEKKEMVKNWEKAEEHTQKEKKEFLKNLEKEKEAACAAAYEQGEQSVLRVKEKMVARGAAGHGQEFNEEYYNRKGPR